MEHKKQAMAWCQANGETNFNNPFTYTPTTTTKNRVKKGDEQMIVLAL